MHPPLDRPHPDCGEEVAKLKECHMGYGKYFGQCNDIKYALDRCLKAEKKRLLHELNKNVPEQRREQEDLIKTAFGKQQTFAEYLAEDRDYLAAKQQKQAGEEAGPPR